MECRVLIYAALASALASNALALTGVKDKYYSILNVAAMSQTLKQQYIQTAEGGVNGNYRKAGAGLYMQAGIGYNILDDLRIDTVIHYDKGAKAKNKIVSSAKNYTFKGRESSFGVLTNVYYDIITDKKLMPYVMGGVGFMKNNLRTEYIASGLQKGSASKSLSKLAYQAGLGFNIRVGANWDLDVGVRILNKGKKKKKKNVTKSEMVMVTLPSILTNVYTKPEYARSFLLGIRRDF